MKSGIIPWIMKIWDGTEVASVNASNQLEVAEANSTAIKTAVEGTLTVDATGQGDVPITLNGEQPGVKFVDESSVAYGVKHIDNKPRVSAMPYTYDIAEGNVQNHEPFGKIGFSSNIGVAESDVWSATGTYTFPSAEQQMEVLSSNNVDDICTTIFGNGFGAAQIIQGDADGSTTALEDDDVDFTGGTAVAVGDVVVLDPVGTTPEWGYVTAVAANTLTCAGGFSSGGTAASRYYTVVDKSATAGAHILYIQYLDGDYAEKNLIMSLNGTTPVTTLDDAGGALNDLFRIQNVLVIGAGANEKPTGNITVRTAGGGTTYGYISAGQNMNRAAIYTVPASKNLYLTNALVSWGYAANQTHYARLYIVANLNPGTDFLTGSIFYPFGESVCANTSQQVDLVFPFHFPQKTDIKISGIASAQGTATVMLRGWLET